MNKKFYLLAIVPAVLAINGCNKTVNDGPAPKYITVSTDIATKVTTAADGTQTFAKGDKISVYAWIGDPATAPAAASRVVDNSINTLGEDGKWTAEPQMLWKNLSDKHFFISVYPENAASEADLTNVACTVDPARQTESDILVATELNGKVADNNPVSLTFDHVKGQRGAQLPQPVGRRPGGSCHPDSRVRAARERGHRRHRQLSHQDRHPGHSPCSHGAPADQGEHRLLLSAHPADRDQHRGNQD